MGGVVGRGGRLLLLLLWSQFRLGNHLYFQMTSSCLVNPRVRSCPTADRGALPALGSEAKTPGSKATTAPHSQSDGHGGAPQYTEACDGPYAEASPRRTEASERAYRYQAARDDL